MRRVGNRKEKVFAVGFNKSGTSSLHALFESLGLRSYHGVKWRDCDDMKLFHSYTCFSDGPPKNLEKLDRIFPKSKFILQTRELDKWVYSRLAHIERAKKTVNGYKVYPIWDNTEYSIKAWIKERQAYHLYVLSYFAERPSDLLVINFIRDRSAATKICEFLGYEGEQKKPRKNVNPRKEVPLKHREMLDRCIAELGIPESELSYDILCPHLINNEVHSRFPVDTG